MEPELTPATPEPITPITAPPSLASLTAEERLTWRKTGQFPTATPAASPAVAEVEDPPASTDATPEADSEPAEPAQKQAYKAKTEKRFQEILARAERAERELATLRQPKPDVRPAPSPAATLAEPNPDTFPYGTMDPGYVKALTAFQVATALETQRAEHAKADTEARTAAEASRVRESVSAQQTVAREKHTDFDAVALAPWEEGAAIAPGSLLDAWIWQSDLGMETLYALRQNHSADIRRINALPQQQQIRELVKLEQKITAKPTLKTVSTAPDPGPTLGTRATAGDVVAAAIKRGDTAAYKREMNAREIAARKGR